MDIRHCVSVLALVGAPLAAQAQEVVTYGYDPLGRLVTTSASGGPNSGTTVSASFDPAGNRTNYNVSSPNTTSFSIAPASAAEGSPVIFTVTRSGPSTASMSVNYATSNGTALAGSDYNATSGMLTFAPAQVAATFSVATINDSVSESTENFSATLSSPSGGAVIGNGTATGTINDNDASPVSFSIANASAVTEGGTLSFVITKTGSTTATTSVNYATANGTAIAGSDYTATSGTLTFSSAEAAKTVSVATTDDALAESAETVLVNLSSPSGGTIATTQGSGTINDNDGWIALTNSALQVQAAHTGTYHCEVVYMPLYGINIQLCYLTADSSPSVYSEDLTVGPSSRTFATGYRMQSNYILEVGAAYYGTN